MAFGFLLLAAGGVSYWVMAASTRGDVWTGLTLRALQIYARLLHRLRIEGAEHRPDRKKAGPLIVVANHTAGVDPLLVQAACRFEIRWIMAEDMRHPAGEPLWKLARVIFVDRREARSGGLRAAIRHIKEGGVVGVFPEGGIERPPRQIRPFQPGVGLLAQRSGARILPVVIDGTPGTASAWGSLLRPSRSRIRFLAPLDPKAEGLRSGEIADRLRELFIAETGWPANETPAPRPPGK